MSTRRSALESAIACLHPAVSVAHTEPQMYSFVTPPFFLNVSRIRSSLHSLPALMSLLNSYLFARSRFLSCCAFANLLANLLSFST
jgi:hypothetical protein